MVERAIKIPESVMHVLDRAIIDGPRLTLTGHLDRKLYQDVNKVIEAAGGKWDRRAKAHVFEDLASDTIEPILLTGEYSRTKQDFGQFDTPPDLAERVANMADIQAGHAVLEPSAGLGNIAKVVRQFGAFVTCWEVDPKRAERLEPIAHSLNIGDFLAAKALPGFDRVVMNPPFARQDDIRHVLHAVSFLKPGGRLAAIMSASVTFRENNLTRDFRSLVESRGGSIERLPDGSFASSGTSVNTCIVVIPSPLHGESAP